MEPEASYEGWQARGGNKKQIRRTWVTVALTPAGPLSDGVVLLHHLFDAHPTLPPRQPSLCF